MDLLAELKTRTRAHHDRIEAAINPMRPGLTRDEYAEMLRRFYGFYAAWEDAAGPWFAGERRDFFDRRRKIPLLEHDLRHLGAADADLAALAHCDELPPTATFADVLGAVYVLEGSTLGGQHICRHLGRTLGLTPDAGCAFFASYREQVGPMWRETQTFLCTHRDGREGAVVSAAAATFDRLAAWVGGHQPARALVG